MKIQATTTLQAPVRRVFDALNDPAILVRTIPGCQQLEQVGPDSYRMTIYAGVASIKGVYQGAVTLSDQQPPNSFRLRASGAGAPGTVDADVQIMLTETLGGETHLQYDADAVVGGMVGGVGQRMLIGVAKKTAGEFFKSIEAVLNDEATVTAEAEPVGALQGDAGTVTEPVDGGPSLYSAPVTTVRPSSVNDFMAGVAVGAALVLVGVLVGSRAGGARGDR